jgi:hypothetical protein
MVLTGSIQQFLAASYVCGDTGTSGGKGFKN